MSEKPELNSGDSNPTQKVPTGMIVFTLVMQLVVMKTLTVLFGAWYSDEPGVGYGYGFAICLTITIILAVRFVLKYKDHDF